MPETTPRLKFPAALAVAIAFTLGACSSGPQLPERDLSGDLPRHYEVGYAEAAIDIDGDLRDAAWRKADWTANFLFEEGRSWSRPKHQARAKLLWDEEFLYLGVWMVDPQLRSEVLSTLRFNGLVTLIADEQESGRYHLLAAEAGGTVHFTTVNPEEHEDARLPGILHQVGLSGTLDRTGDADKGWWLEMAIPWARIRSSERASVPVVGDDLRLNWRYRGQAWSPTYDNSYADPQVWGIAQLVR